VEDERRSPEEKEEKPGQDPAREVAAVPDAKIGEGEEPSW
jgi:hypothetical protein